MRLSVVGGVPAGLWCFLASLPRHLRAGLRTRCESLRAARRALNHFRYLSAKPLPLFQKGPFAALRMTRANAGPSPPPHRTALVGDPVFARYDKSITDSE